MTCKNCGKELPDGSTVCFECGATQTENLVQAPNATIDTPVVPKSKAGAAILALLLGGWGAHDFYLGFTKKAIIKIVLTIVSFGFIGGLWGFIDFIRILCGNINVDAKGTPIM